MDFRFGVPIKDDDQKTLDRLYRRRAVAVKRGDRAATTIIDSRINSIVKRVINPSTPEYRGL